VDRLRAFRAAHRLRKITLDVPETRVEDLREFAKDLRKIGYRNPYENMYRHLDTMITYNWHHDNREYSINTQDFSISIKKLASPGSTQWEWRLSIHKPPSQVRAGLTMKSVNTGTYAIPFAASGITSTLAHAKRLGECVLNYYFNGEYEWEDAELRFLRPISRRRSTR
jgi:hypothetical protein